MNIQKLKNDFPFFSSPKNRRQPVIYLDSAATTQKPQMVIDAIVDFYTNRNANVHRTLYNLGEDATVLYEQAREKIARFINAKHPEEIIFTKGTTESINFVASTWAAANLHEGDQIVLSRAEHHSNLLPWQHAASVTSTQLKFIEIDSENYTFVNPESFLTPAPKLVAITYDSNVLGPVWNHQNGQLKNFITAAHKVGAKVLIDAAQIVAHKSLDVQALDADFVAFSGHKMFGPTGIGVLYIKRELHDQIQPYQFGGSMVHSVSFTDATWATAPQKFEAGTPPIADAIGLGAAVDYIKNYVDFKALAQHEAVLCAQLLDGLGEISGITIVGNQSRIKEQGHLVSFSVDGIHAHDIAAYLGNQGIAVRAGHHCAQPLANLLGFESLVRASVSLYNTPEDVSMFLDALTTGIKFLREM